MLNLSVGCCVSQVKVASKCHSLDLFFLYICPGRCLLQYSFDYLFPNWKWKNYNPQSLQNPILIIYCSLCFTYTVYFVQYCSDALWLIEGCPNPIACQYRMLLFNFWKTVCVIFFSLFLIGHHIVYVLFVNNVSALSFSCKPWKTHLSSTTPFVLIFYPLP